MHDFINTVFNELWQAVPPALIGLAVGAAVLVPLRRKCRGGGWPLRKGQAWAIVLLTGWLGALSAITLIGRMDYGMRTDIQLRPFLALREAWNAFTLRAWLNPLLNIAMFLPLGLLLPLAAKPFRRWYRTLAAGAGVSLLIEAIQYILRRGQADVDDLLCNTLGAVLGYCLCMLFVSLAEKRRRRAAACAVLPVLFAAALAGVFIAYRVQPYGNLADAPIYAADIKGVEWVCECELSDEPGPSGVYRTEPFTKEECDAFAVEFIGRLGAEIRFGTADVQYYDETAVYSDHSTYVLWVEYKDRSYSYTDFSVDHDLVCSGKGGTITESELRAALDRLGIEVPAGAELATVDGERGEYVFRARYVSEDGVLTAGELSCRVLEGGVLYDVNNALFVGTPCGEASVISSREAYDRLCAGRFSWRDVPGFEYLSPTRVRVAACELEYMTDSKGFRQPVYAFTLLDDSGTDASGGRVWNTFVPALSVT